MRILERSRAHLESVGESYFGHMSFALRVGLLMVLAGAACVTHALVPALFPDRASRTIRRLNAALDDRALITRGDNEAPAAALPLLALLSAVAALLPWAGSGDPIIALPMTLLALAFPVAYLVSGAEGSEVSGGSHPLGGKSSG